MTTQANFESAHRRSNLTTRDIHAAHVGRRIARAPARLCRMRVMAIGTLDVPQIDNSRFDRIMDRRRVPDTMRRWLVHNGHDIIRGHVAVMAAGTIVFFGRRPQ